ncbi:T9SS type A sorting domain-containing protein [Hymenobacter tibetensis]|uniref:T9SS type A sorting domain-containing protein n=1 Tax=Hymenobacter tibetensis TaxID=497967 RepID=A0ABY4CWS2_9BACT|nr:T9SS type A sorting domain-containing protein [Hymenobacter tibetensis]UOG74217.1 T9SS type A sorting domain-containing protein [Hymenobacter tibetensis]
MNATLTYATFMPRFFYTQLGVLCTLLLLLIASPQAQAQAPAWQPVVMGNQISNASYSNINATTTDASGNVYSTGYFRGVAHFGSITLTSAGSYDAFVVKWSPTAGYVWAQRMGGAANEVATAVAVNGTSVYVAGTFEGPVVQFGATTLTNNYRAGEYDMFVTKLTDAGSSSSFSWTKQAGGSGYDQITALAVSGTSVYIGGQFLNTARFGTQAITSIGTYDLFVAKLTDAGSTASFLWAERAGSPTSDAISALAVQGTSVYVAGSFRGPTASFGNSTLANAGNSDAFVAKLVDAGASASFTWAQGAGGTGADRATALAVNNSNVYVTGHFGQSGAAASFGATTLTSAGGADVFVAKLTETVNGASFVWVQQAGGLQDESVNAIAVQGSSVYVAGGFTSAIVRLGNTTIINRNTNLTSDVFAAKLSDAGRTGSFTWVQQAGGEGDDAASGVVLSGTSVYVAGYVVAPATFGNQTISNSSNAGVGFLAALTDMALPTKSSSLTALAGMSIYPNPAHTHTTVVVPAVSGVTQATVTLSDVVGRTVRTQNLRLATTGTKADVSLEDLKPGLYRVQVQAGSETITRSLAIN